METTSMRASASTSFGATDDTAAAWETNADATLRYRGAARANGVDDGARGEATSSSEGSHGSASTSMRAAFMAVVSMGVIAMFAVQIDSYVVASVARTSADDAAAAALAKFASPSGIVGGADGGGVSGRGSMLSSDSHSGVAKGSSAKTSSASGGIASVLEVGKMGLEFDQDEAVAEELRIGDDSVAYVAQGWNAERRLIGDDKIEAIWEGPAEEDENGELRASPPRGALLALHGCHHNSKDFFAQNAKCTECRGLPQEMTITRTALNRGYVVIAISSLGTCWSKDIDGPRVQKVLDVFYNETALTDLPLYAFGASSGGSFVGLLPTITPKNTFSGLVIQIAPGPTGLTTRQLNEYPPTVFSHMPRDTRTEEFVASSIRELHAAGMRNVRESQLQPQPIEDDYFYHASFGKITLEESTGMANTLRTFNLVDENNMLTDDPRAFDADHVEALRLHAPEWDSLLADQSDVRELLNVAYAVHELSAGTFSSDFAWLTRQRATMLSDLT
jgi:hypothetical protein